jgi:segregation and condensation protein A
MPDYRIRLDTYSGPMDLLLYLIRREEVDIYDIPLAKVLAQYMAYVRVLKTLDPEAAGDFLVMAATLMEIKSRMLLPKPPPEDGDGDDLLDPRADLVRQLLAYRTFREAAGELGHRADMHQRRFGRPTADVPDGEEHVDLEDVQIWDLLQAFNELMASVGAQHRVHEIKYDDTPVALHALDITDRLQREGPSMTFARVFEGRTRGELIGLFLALLELIRQKRVRVEQQGRFGTIVVHLLDATPINTTADDEPETEVAQDVSAGREEPQEQRVEPGDEPVEAAEAGDAQTPQDDEQDGEDDEFGRRIDAIRVADVDLGRSPEEDTR